MSERIREPEKTSPEFDHRDDDSAVIETTGASGVVKTKHGETSVGTTPIRQGSVPADEAHRPATDRRLRDSDDRDARR
jgi:hypothetical protein